VQCGKALTQDGVLGPAVRTDEVEHLGKKFLSRIRSRFC
jgi:hypothetical protein